MNTNDVYFFLPFVFEDIGRVFLYKCRQACYTEDRTQSEKG